MSRDGERRAREAFALVFPSPSLILCGFILQPNPSTTQKTGA